MPFNFNAGQKATLERLGRSGSEPVWMVELQTLAHRWLTVTDYTAPSIGDQIHVRADTTDSYVVLELAAGAAGTLFERGSSNVEQARNIANAGRAQGLRAVAEGAAVHFVLNSTFDDLSFNQIDHASWVDTSATSSLLAPLSRIQRFLSHTMPGIDADPIIKDTTTPGWKKDVRTKKWGIADVSVTFADEGTLRGIIRRVPLTRKLLKLFIGDEACSLSDFVPCGAYVYVDHATSGGNSDLTEHTPVAGTITLILRDYVTWLMKRKKVLLTAAYPPSRVNKHPLEELEDLLEFSNIPASLYDATTLSLPISEGPAWDHINVGRFNYASGGIQLFASGPTVDIEMSSGLDKEPTVLAMVDQLRLAMRGQFGPEEDGVWRWRGRDIALDSAVRTWTRDVFIPDTPDTYAENAMSEITFDLLSQVQNRDFEKKWVFEDQDASILNAGDFDTSGSVPPDTAPGKVGNTGWQNGCGYLKLTPSIAGLRNDVALPAWITVEFAGLTPFAGCGFDGKVGSGGSNTINANRRLNGGSKVGYILLEAEAGGRMQQTFGDPNDKPGGREIFRVVDTREHAGGVYPVWDVQGGSQAGIPLYYPRCDLQLDQRGLLGTSTPYLWQHGCRVIDITAAYIYAQELVERSRFGMPIITGTTRLDQWDVQVGEKVVIPHSSYITYRNDGALATEFEVIGKRIGKGFIRWTLAFAKHDILTLVPVVVPVAPVYTPPVAVLPGDYYYDGSGVDYVDGTGEKYWKVF